MTGDDDSFAAAMGIANTPKEQDGVFYYNFKPYFFTWTPTLYVKETDLIRKIISSKWGAIIDSYRHFEDIPVWDGEDYAHCIVGANCNYFLTHRAPLNTIINLWGDEETDEAREKYQRIDAWIRQMNLDLLKRSDFVSKRANTHIISNVDIGKLTDKFSKQISNHGNSK